MPDTLIYSSQQDIQHLLDSLPPDVRSMLEQTIQNTQPPPNDVNWTVIIFTLAAMFGAALIIYKILIYKYAKSPLITNTTYPGYYIYDGNNIRLSDEDILAILNKYSPYYKSLNSEMQTRFEKRTKDFMKAKIFIIPSSEAYKEMPVLLSATAVQLTFGLDSFLLPWFQYIQIHTEEYFADDPHALRVLAGHVSNNTITIAWNQFLNGFREEHDGANVGLHEMSHALYYQETVASQGKEKKFAQYFKEVMDEGEEVYELKSRSPVLFTDYAFRNLQEFWAESVEIFFERPVEMRESYSDLFKSLTELLQQDPVNKTNPLLVS